jgi:hypothetical protein
MHRAVLIDKLALDLLSCSQGAQDKQTGGGGVGGGYAAVDGDAVGGSTATSA